jgi:hypothetical protein
MKLRWWLVGTGALVGGSVLILGWWLKRNGLLHFVDSDEGEKNFGAFPPEIPESEFEGFDFLA